MYHSLKHRRRLPANGDVGSVRLLGCACVLFIWELGRACEDNTMMFNCHPLTTSCVHITLDSTLPPQNRQACSACAIAPCRL